MRTNIDLEDSVVEEAMTLTGLRTKKEVVHLALVELVRLRRKRDLSDLAGKVSFAPDFDHKTLRRLRRGAR